MVELVVLVLLGLSCFGIGLKYCIYQCDIKDELEVNIIETIDYDNEPPPKYEDI
jgi:hypothetical protein